MKYTITLYVLLLSAFAFAGKGDDNVSKFQKVFFKSGIVDMNDVTITIENAVANDELFKFKMVVKNNTSEFLWLKPGEIVVVVDGKEYKATERDMFVEPNGEASKVIDFKGPTFRTEQLIVKFKGFNSVEVTQKQIAAPNFKLPVSQNSFEAGAFKLNQLETEKKTDFVSIKFSVTYEGANVGIVSPALAALKFPNGTEYANMKARTKPILFGKGESDNFRMTWRDIPVSNGDAQFANLEILWRDAFKEGKLNPIPAQDFTLEWDPGMTKGKNR